MILSHNTNIPPLGDDFCCDRFQCLWIMPFETATNEAITENGSHSFFYRRMGGEDHLASRVGLVLEERVLEQRTEVGDVLFGKGGEQLEIVYQTARTQLASRLNPAFDT
jgi:hypothetical protein